MENEMKLERAVIDPLSKLILNTRFEISRTGSFVQNSEIPLKEFTAAQCELLYLAEGNLTLTCNGKSFDCGPGSLCFLEPFSNYQVDFSGEHPARTHYICFDLLPLYHLKELQQAVLGDGEVVFSAEELQDCGALRSLLCFEGEGGYGDYAQRTSAIIYALVLMGRARNRRGCTQPILEPSGRELEIVSQSMDFIENNLEKPLKISDISAHVGVSDNYLYKAFVNVVMIPPSKYILQYKVQRAEKMLRTGAYKVSDIAAALGFSSMFHFSKTYKDYFGLSPKQYLKNVSETQPKEKPKKEKKSRK